MISRDILYNSLQLQEKKKRRKAANEMREALGDAAPPKPVPKTIESMRTSDVTTVEGDDVEVREQ